MGRQQHLIYNPSGRGDPLSEEKRKESMLSLTGMRTKANDNFVKVMGVLMVLGLVLGFFTVITFEFKNRDQKILDQKKMINSQTERLK